jgi:hypothetical protein
MLSCGSKTGLVNDGRTVNFVAGIGEGVEKAVLIGQELGRGSELQHEPVVKDHHSVVVLDGGDSML